MKRNSIHFRAGDLRPGSGRRRHQAPWRLTHCHLVSSIKKAKNMDEPVNLVNSSTKSTIIMDEPGKTVDSSILLAKIMDELAE